MLGLHVRRMEAQMDLPGESPRRLFQEHDFLGKNLRFLVAGIDFADDEDRLVGGEHFPVAIIVFVQAQHLDGPFQVFQRDQ